MYQSSVYLFGKVYNIQLELLYANCVNLYGWDIAFSKIYKIIHKFDPGITQKTRELAPVNPWGNQEWKIFHAFRTNPRKKVVATLHDIDVTYEQYKKWKKELNKYCSIHTRFYPLGIDRYMVYKFLFSTDYEHTLREIAGLFPATPVITEIGNKLMVTVYVVNPENCRNLFCMVNDLKTKKIVKKVKKSMNIFSRKKKESH